MPRGANKARIVNRGAGTDVASQIEKLEGLLERGTLTHDEFDEQKRKLLDG